MGLSMSFLPVICYFSCEPLPGVVSKGGKGGGKAVARVERGAVPGKARPAEREKGSRDMGREKAVPPRPQRGWKVVYSLQVKT